LKNQAIRPLEIPRVVVWWENLASIRPRLQSPESRVQTLGVSGGHEADHFGARPESVNGAMRNGDPIMYYSVSVLGNKNNWDDYFQGSITSVLLSVVQTVGLSD